MNSFTDPSLVYLQVSEQAVCNILQSSLVCQTRRDARRLFLKLSAVTRLCKALVGRALSIQLSWSEHASHSRSAFSLQPYQSFLLPSDNPPRPRPSRTRGITMQDTSRESITVKFLLLSELVLRCEKLVGLQQTLYGTCFFKAEPFKRMDCQAMS